MSKYLIPAVLTIAKACELEATCDNFGSSIGGIGAIYPNWGVGGGVFNGCGAGSGSGFGLV